MSKKILIIDDEEDFVDIVSVYFEREGYKTTCAYDGLEALEKIDTDKPDLIILDIMMPKLNGYLVNLKLKEKQETKNIPVIVVTGKGDLSEIIDAKKKNIIVDYFKKPFKIKDLLMKTQNTLSTWKN
jgi:DNA-binding response OmpR family regulator